MELKIEDLIYSNKIDSLRPVASEVGKAYRIDDAQGRYIVYLKNSFPKDLDLQGLKIVLDGANGAAYKVAPAVLQELGAEVITIGVDPDGTNINAGCGSMHPEGIAEAVRENRAHLGMALDGDADRVIFVDEFGNEVDGDQIMAICGTAMLKEGKLAKQTVVATVMSNMGLDIAMKQAGGKVVKTAVGDRYVVEEMRRGGYNLGGEQSGHMIFLDHSTTGDGMLTGLALLDVVQRSGRQLSQLAADAMTQLPQVLINVPVAERRSDVNELLAAEISAAAEPLGSTGRILVRPSGTEPLVRVMVEAPTAELARSTAEHLADVVRQHPDLAT